MKLYTVTATFKYVVVANNAKKAKLVAEDEMGNAFREFTPAEIETSITEGATAQGWDDECFPYGGDGSKQIGEYK